MDSLLRNGSSGSECQDVIVQARQQKFIKPRHPLDKMSTERMAIWLMNGDAILHISMYMHQTITMPISQSFGWVVPTIQGVRAFLSVILL
jgi:hypothetical protein